MIFNASVASECNFAFMYATLIILVLRIYIAAPQSLKHLINSLFAVILKNGLASATNIIFNCWMSGSPSLDCS